jgi:hypothetical protein
MEFLYFKKTQSKKRSAKKRNNYTSCPCLYWCPSFCLFSLISEDTNKRSMKIRNQFPRRGEGKVLAENINTINHLWIKHWPGKVKTKKYPREPRSYSQPLFHRESHKESRMLGD